MADVRKRIIFRGRVQGVGFRYTAKYLAQSLGPGPAWVRNEYDGPCSWRFREAIYDQQAAGGIEP